MQVVTIEFSRTRQVNQYEPENLKLVANLEEGEDLHESIAKIRHEVHVALGLAEGKKTPEKKAKKDVETVEGTADEPSTKKTKKKATKKKAAKKKSDEPAKEFSAAEVKALFVKVVKGRGMEVAKDILSDLGVGHTSELEENQHTEAVKLCEKALS